MALGIAAWKTDGLVAMPISSLTAEKSKELKSKIATKKAEREQIAKTAPSDFYLGDLHELRGRLTGRRIRNAPPPAPTVKKDAGKDFFEFIEQ